MTGGRSVKPSGSQNANYCTKLGLDRPEDCGKPWTDAWGDFLRESGFINIHKTTRSRLRSCMEHRAEIEDWLSKMDIRERFHWNHPSTIWQHWQRHFGVTAGKRKERGKIEELTDANLKLQEERDRLQAELEQAHNEITWVKQEAETLRRGMRTDDPAFGWRKDPVAAGWTMATAFPDEAKALAEVIIGTFNEIREAEIARAHRMTPERRTSRKLAKKWQPRRGDAAAGT